MTVGLGLSRVRVEVRVMVRVVRGAVGGEALDEREEERGGA